MIDSIKKVLYAGVGVFALSEEKTKEIIAELVKQGEITRQDGEKVLNELKDKFVSTGKSFEEKLLNKAKEYLRIQELEKRLDNLEKDMEELKKK
jgi:polyhydroxyalkanoate synthesis regulator phasin